MEQIVKYTLIAEEISLKRTQINSANDVYIFSKNIYTSDILIYESAFLLLLNSGSILIGYFRLSTGAINYTSIDPILALKVAIDSLAIGVILVHNHPSGILKASAQDKKMNQSLKKAFEAIGIKFLDSVIVTNNGYESIT